MIRKLALWTLDRKGNQMYMLIKEPKFTPNPIPPTKTDDEMFGLLCQSCIEVTMTTKDYIYTKSKKSEVNP